MRELCIFCPTKLDKSDEHIIPQSINGRLHTRDLICSTCNGRFGARLDPVLKETLYVILHILNIGNAENLVVEDEEGTKYIANSQGKIKRIKTDIKLYKKNDQIGIHASGEKNSALQAFVKKAVRIYGAQETIKLVQSRKIRYTEKSVVPKELKAKSTIVITPKLQLALSKIITEFFCLSGLNEELIENRLKKVYNLDESDPDVIICNLDHSVRKPEKNEVTHVILIKDNPVKKQIYAYVELFNVICGFTVLVENYNGPSVEKTYYQNAITGEVINKQIAIEIPDQPVHDFNFDFVVKELIKRKRDDDIESAVRNMDSKVKEDLDLKLTKGDIDQDQHLSLFMEATSKWVAQLMVDHPEDFEDEFSDESKLNYIHSTIIEAHKEQFEFFYHQLINLQFEFVEENKMYIMAGFHYVKTLPKMQIERLKVYCHFVSVDKRKEQHIPIFEVFSRIGMPPPPEDVSWLN